MGSLAGVEIVGKKAMSQLWRCYIQHKTWNVYEVVKACFLLCRNTSATSIEARESHNLVVHDCLFEANINDAATNEYRFNKSSLDLDDLNILSSCAGAISVYSNSTIGLEIESIGYSAIQYNSQ